MRREKPPVESETDGSGWAHYERIASSELRFAGWCPAELGMCDRNDVRHGWKGDGARYAHLRVRSSDD